MLSVINNNDSGAGSLRQAIADAVPGEEIQFAIIGSITLTSASLSIAKNLTITGPGANSLTIASGGAFRVFDLTAGIISISDLAIANGSDTDGAGIQSTTTLTLTNVILTGNMASNDGGGLHSNQTTTLDGCQFNGNVAGNNGGGLWSSGTVLQVNRTDFDSNVATADGGAIWNSGTATFAGDITDNEGGNAGGVLNGGTIEFIEATISGCTQSGVNDSITNNFGTMTFTRTTLSGNNLASSATVNNVFGTVIVNNSTISGNAGAYGLLNNSGAIAIANSTIVNNGFGIFQVSGSALTIYDTILAGNVGSDLISHTADVSSSGNNIFGTTTNPVTPGAGDQFGLNYAALVIGPLQNNGGPTFTHALLPTSPALDAGNNTGAPATDQRGQPRIIFGTIDIGAYEAAAPCVIFTGTLPGWISIVGNCLIGAPGTFRGTTKAEATAKAQAALDAFVAAAIAIGDLICNPFPSEEVYFDMNCPDGEDIEFTGSLPSWITVDVPNDRLVGAAGTYTASSQSAANAAAQSALDDFANAAIGDGDLVCASDVVIDWSDFSGKSCASDDDPSNFYHASTTSANATHVVIDGTASSNGNIVGCGVEATVINSVAVNVHWKWSGTCSGDGIDFCIGSAPNDCNILSDGFNPFAVGAGPFSLEGDFTFGITAGTSISINGAIFDDAGDPTATWTVELTITPI